MRPSQPAGASLQAEDSDEWSPPSTLGLAMRATSFYSRCTALLASYVPVFIKSRLSGEAAGADQYADDPLEVEWRDKHESGATALSTLIDDLKGFYVKVGQVIATRSDLFPKEYSKKLSRMVDSVNPMPFSVVKRTVEEELLGGLPLSDAFESFDPVPLGSASIAQVHKATLKGGQVVAVKVQRPFVEERLLSDISVVKNFSLLTREIFPVDYYVVCRELEEQLQDEFDFNMEASSMERVHAALKRNGRQPSVVVPQSIPGMYSRRVLCMDFIDGAPLSRLREEMRKRGIDIEPGSRAEQIFGRNLLQSLTDAFAVMVFEEGFFHADPHPGNIFILPDGQVSLIDFGQTKQIDYKFRSQIAQLMILTSDYNRLTKEGGTQSQCDEALKQLGDFGSGMGVEFLPSAGPKCGGALAIWLFDSSRRQLPDGYEANELSPNCPVRDVASFPRDFVLLCRMTLLIRGIAMQLNIDWSLADAWREPSLQLLSGDPVSVATERPNAGRYGWLVERILKWKYGARQE